MPGGSGCRRLRGLPISALSVGPPSALGLALKSCSPGPAERMRGEEALQQGGWELGL